MNPELLSPKQFAQAFGVSQRTVYNWLAEERLDHFRIGGTVRIPADEITKALKRKEEVASLEGGFIAPNQHEQNSTIRDRMYKMSHVLYPGERENGTEENCNLGK